MMTVSPLKRLTNTCWSFSPNSSSTATINPTGRGIRCDLDEIRLEVPSYLDGEKKYKLVTLVASILQEKTPTFKSLQKPLFLKSNFGERWKLTATQTNQTAFQSFIQKIPFCRIISSQKIINLSLEKRRTSPCRKIIKLANERFFDISKITLPILKQPFHPNEPLERRLAQPLFSDPFTNLATIALQTIDPFFVFEKAHRSTLQFILKDGQLQLVSIESIRTNTIPRISAPVPVSKEAEERPNSPRMTASLLDVSLERQGSGFSDPLRQQQDENRDILTLFIRHLRQEYGSWIIGFLKQTYDLDLSKMYEQGLPLYPDHVFKANIGANNIEFGHLFALIETLNRIVQNIKESPTELQIPFQNYLLQRNEFGNFGHISLREIRKLTKQVQAFTHREEPILVNDVYQYIKTILPENKNDPEHLSPTQLNALIQLLVSTDEELDRAFTGRKISHSAIFGYHTMGNKQIANPCRDHFEILHLFKEMRESSWTAYYELLGHVLAKKSLYRPNIDATGWHVGLIIPGPTVNGDSETWYFNDTFLDDSKGNFSYTLKPASIHYRMQPEDHLKPQKHLPYIKLYRSTASDKSNLNSLDSIAADLNPHGSPGSLNSDLSYAYEHENFEARTIPMWMGYVLLGFQYQDLPALSYDRWMNQAVSLFEEYLRDFPLKGALIPEIEVLLLKKQLQDKQYPQLLDSLISFANRLDEDPRKKISQDIAFVGHSLGGGLAQDGVFQFCTKTKRIPLPESNIICSTSHPPSIDNVKNTRFMLLGQEHQEMLYLNKICFQISHQFEKGDFVPQGGESHLGTPPYPPQKITLSPTEELIDRKQQWINFHAHIFAPLISAKSLEIADVPTHGRRIGSSQRNRDYSYQELTAQQVGTFDHAYLLKGEVRKAFGYRIFNSPKFSEWFRKGLAKIARPIFKTIEKFNGPGIGERDVHGVWYMTFCRKRALRQLFSPSM